MFKLIRVNKNNYNKIYELFIKDFSDKFSYSKPPKFKTPNRIIEFFKKEYNYIINFENKPVGFFTIKIIDKYTIKINEFFLENKYYSNFKFSSFPIFKNKTIVFSMLSKECINELYINNSLIELNSNYLFKKKLSSINYQINDKVLTFRNFRCGFDEELRCDLQNDIFYSKERIPLTVEEIKCEVNSDSFIDNLSFFMHYNNIPIGYVQVVLWQNNYLIVNFGVVDKYRSRGYGKKLLLFLLNEMSNMGIDEVFIKVGINNFKAKNLYLSCGFEKVGIFKEFICQIS